MRLLAQKVPAKQSTALALEGQKSQSLSHWKLPRDITRQTCCPSLVTLTRPNQLIEEDCLFMGTFHRNSELKTQWHRLTAGCTRKSSGSHTLLIYASTKFIYPCKAITNKSLASMPLGPLWRVKVPDKDVELLLVPNSSRLSLLQIFEAIDFLAGRVPNQDRAERNVSFPL